MKAVLDHVGIAVKDLAAALGPPALAVGGLRVLPPLPVPPIELAELHSLGKARSVEPAAGETVVGVVENVRHNALTREVKPQFYATLAHFARAESLGVVVASCAKRRPPGTRTGTEL